jgi:hypothetical protein
VVKFADDSFLVYMNSRFEPTESIGVSKGDFEQLKPYWSLLEDAAAHGDLAQVDWLAPRSAFQQGLRSLQVRLTGTATLVSAAKVIDASKAAAVVLARSKDFEQHGDWALKLLWTDGSGRDLEGPLSAIRGGGFRFSLPDAGGAKAD